MHKVCQFKPVPYLVHIACITASSASNLLLEWCHVLVQENPISLITHAVDVLTSSPIECIISFLLPCFAWRSQEQHIE